MSIETLEEHKLQIEITLSFLVWLKTGLEFVYYVMHKNQYAQCTLYILHTTYTNQIQK